MDIKKKQTLRILLLAGFFVLIGIGAWLLFHPDIKPAANNKPISDQNSTPSIQLNIPESSFAEIQEKHSLNVSIKTDDYGDIARVEYVLDDKLAAYSTESPFSVSLDLSQLAEGNHTLQAVAYGKNGSTSKSPVFTFTISADKTVEAADEASREIIRQSRSIGTLIKSTSTNASNSGNNETPGGGGNPIDSTPWPDAPPAQICGNTSLLSGPSSAPAGAIIVPEGDNSSVTFTNADTTYWFAPGVHKLGTDQFSQIIPGNNSTFVGAPGAVIDGQGLNSYAFTQHATNVKIQYLTIKNFVTPRDEGTINHDSGAGWTIEYITAQDNGGGAVFAGTNNVLRYSCLKDNGQYGFQVYNNDPGGPSNVLLDHNEIVGNNTDDWEAQVSGCGCTGGGKFWDAHTVTVTNNYVHNNLSVGLWADTNDTDFLVEGNYIENNDGQGLFYETSYNMIVRNNSFIRNALVDGPGNPSFPTGAIYLSESGGDSRIAGRTDKIEIYDNQFVDNWSGVVLWENADRFCASPANTSSGYCTIVNPSATLTTCGNPSAGGSVNVEPYKSDCRWKTQNVTVHNNVFSLNRSAIAGCAMTNGCGFQGIFSNTGTFPSWSPYMGSGIQQAITFNQNNHFSNNTYLGDWRYRAKTENTTSNFAIWQGAPYSQDVGSTYNGQDHQFIANFLDDDTATLEGSIGQWVDWFSATVSRSTAEAHTGTHSLKISITDPFGWGAQLSDSVGPLITHSDKKVSFWAKLGSGTNLQARMEAQWLDENQNLVRTDAITSPVLTNTWQETSQVFTPPAGAVTVRVVVVHNTGTTGNSLYIDDIVVGDNS